MPTCAVLSVKALHNIFIQSTGYARAKTAHMDPEKVAVRQEDTLVSNSGYTFNGLDQNNGAANSSMQQGELQR